MNPWATLDHLVAITSARGRRLRSEDLIAEIADALATSGQYVTHVDLLPTQQIIDFNWAAHQAARRLGIRIQVDSKYARASADGRVQVSVTPLPPPE
jgi:hypothetical protein